MSLIKNVPIHRLVIRVSLVLLWIGLGFLIFFTHRGHTLLVDNKGAADGSYQAVKLMNVKIDKQNEKEMMSGDRIRLTASGQKHKILVEFTDGRQPVEREFILPIKEDMYLLSVPKMLAEMDFVEPFRTSDQVREVREEDPEEPTSFSF